MIMAAAIACLFALAGAVALASLAYSIWRGARLYRHYAAALAAMDKEAAQ